MTSIFDKSGAMSFPAGVATGCMRVQDPALDLNRPWGQQDTHHLSSAFSQMKSIGVVPTGWMAKEPSVKPGWSQQAAGMHSVVDNTMRLSPLKPFWGQTRPLTSNEVPPSQRVLPEDTLAGIKTTRPLASIGSAEMGSVLDKYSPAVAVFDYKYDPARLSSGFITSPAVLGKSLGSTGSNSSPMLQTPSPNAHAGSKLRKFEFDQTAGLAHIPVARRALAL